MKKRTYWFIGSIIIMGLACYFLISGSSVLTLSLSKSSNIPLGTFITWFGIIALTLVFYFSINRLRKPQSKTDRIFALLLKIFIVLAILWVPISYLLAGNISFTFTEKLEFQGGQLAMKMFWYNTYITVAAPLVLGMAFGLYSLFRRKPGKNS